MIGHLPDVPDHLQRPFDILMGGVDSYHIHPGVVERREERHVAAPVGDCGDDLRFFPELCFHDGTSLPCLAQKISRSEAGKPKGLDSHLTPCISFGSGRGFEPLTFGL